jgi:hypothetical protein
MRYAYIVVKSDSQAALQGEPESTVVMQSRQLWHYEQAKPAINGVAFTKTPMDRGSSGRGFDDS